MVTVKNLSGLFWIGSKNKPNLAIGNSDAKVRLFPEKCACKGAGVAYIVRNGYF